MIRLDEEESFIENTGGDQKEKETDAHGRIGRILKQE